MEEIFVDELLTQNGLQLPNLSVLKPDDKLYTLLVCQPSGPGEASQDFIGNAKSALGVSDKYLAFLSLASSVDLAITPEYSCPWNVIEQALSDGIFPKEHGLWVIGCESTTWAELSARVSLFAGIRWFHDDKPESGETGRFFDPVCYIFRTRDDSGTLTTVVLVQCKSQPMADQRVNLERDWMVRGRKRYMFREGQQSIRLFALLCSDSLSFTMRDLKESYLDHPYLVLHLQMNSDPRNSPFCQYRHECYNDDVPHCEFVCVNWSSFSFGKQFVGGGSGIYTKSTRVRRFCQQVCKRSFQAAALFSFSTCSSTSFLTLTPSVNCTPR